MVVEATWRFCLTSDALQRSSHCVDVVDGIGYVFGGELLPRQPRDNQIWQVNFKASNDTCVNGLSTKSVGPPPRVGSASAVLSSKIYVFSGRGGEDMAPIEEQGAVWVFDSVTSQWSLSKPSNPSDQFPQARSYHCATSDGSHSIFVHAGCPATGRLSDLWSFDVNRRTWTKHADAPAPERGGPSIAFAGGKLYRMNGFDGKREQGGTLDVYDPKSNTWDFRPFDADGTSGPGARSVGALIPVVIQGGLMLVTLFGEGDPSALGHAGAGKMFNDIWAYSINHDEWHKVVTQQDANKAPLARGWFDASRAGESEIVVSGGLAGDNKRLQDCWLLSF